MNIKEIKEVINLMNENDLMEIELEKDGLKIRLRKAREGAVETSVSERLLERPPVASVTRESHPEPNVPPKSKGMEIKSPMVGTFYKSPAPDAPPYVKVGDSVEIGQVVCIIEAMKLMNEIKSEVKGRIAACLVENADPIEFNQALFLVEPL